YATPEAETLRERGYVKLSPGYGGDLLRQLASQFSELIEDPKHSMVRTQSANRGHPDASRRLIHASASMPALQALINESVQRTLLAYYGGHFQWIEAMAYRNRHVMDRTKEVYSNAWHFDHINTAYLQLFIYLSDNVNAEETGAFRIIARDQSRRLSRRGYLHRRIVLGPARRMIDDPTIVHHMEGGLGTAFLVAN